MLKTPNNDLNQDFKSYTCQVLSPELPCGSAWLANCFIELNIAVVNKWDLTIDNEWKRISPFHYMYNDKKSWQQVVPSLKYQNKYSFHPKHAISFQHIWPFMANNNSKTILFIRHPFDALFSFWRRQAYNFDKKTGDFKDLMNQKYYHYNFTVKDYLLIYCSILEWFVKNNNCLIIKFEEYKYNAVATLKKALDYLDINKTDEQIQSAVNKSDVLLLLAIENTIKKQGKLNYKNHFKGQAFEFNKSYSQNMIDDLDGVFDDFSQWQSYPTPPISAHTKSSIQLSDKKLQVITASICQHNPKFHETMQNILKPIRQQITWKDDE